MLTMTDMAGVLPEMAPRPRLDRYWRKHTWTNAFWRVCSSEIGPANETCNQRHVQSDRIRSYLPHTPHTSIYHTPSQDDNDPSSLLELYQVTDRLYTLRARTRLRYSVHHSPQYASRQAAKLRACIHVYAILCHATVRPGSRSGPEGSIPFLEIESIPKLEDRGYTSKNAVLGETCRVHINLDVARLVCWMVRRGIDETWDV